MQSARTEAGRYWAAVAERLLCRDLAGARRAAIAGSTTTAKRQTGKAKPLRTIRAPLPAVVAVSEAINEPRYPSLKGIMGAKSKPQEVLLYPRRRP